MTSGFDRRTVLTGGALALALASTSCFTRTAMAAGGSGAQRLIVINLRGAADMLALFPPVGDPGLAALRDDLQQRMAQINAPLPLGAGGGGLFAVHGALATVHGLMTSGEAVVVHAAATPYRDRSHFEAQNVLETGGTRAYGRQDGWLNRTAGLLAQVNASVVASDPLAIGAAMPLLLRGDAPATSYAPSRGSTVSDDLADRLSRLYGEDELLHAAWQSARTTQGMLDSVGADDMTGRGMSATGGGRGSTVIDAVTSLLTTFLNAPDGPHIISLDYPGWDTHANQPGALARLAGGLDRLVGETRKGLGPRWDDTLLVVMSEFGRTAAANGTQGTDHGTGGALLLAGGALRRRGPQAPAVVADWPGLRTADLFEGRDLRATTDVRAALTSALASHFAVDPDRFARTVFPDAGQLARLAPLSWVG